MKVSDHRESYLQGNIINKCYVVSIYDGLEDDKIKNLCENTIKMAHSNEVNGVIFSFVNVNIIDSYTINIFINTTKTIMLFGVRTVWTGLKPGLITSILDFNIDMDDILTCRNLDDGIIEIQKSLDEEIYE